MGLWDWFIQKPKKKQGVRILDNEGLLKSMKDSAYSKRYSRLRRVYHRGQLKERIKGRKVKCWKIVKCGSDSMYDEFIPIFYKKRFRRRKKK